MLEKQETELEIINQKETLKKRNIKIMKQTTNFVMVAIATVVISTNGIFNTGSVFKSLSSYT